MRFIDWFAGVGGFRRGLELAGHKCVGFCEFDKFAYMSYVSMHLITEEQREYLSTLDIKARQQEIMKEEYRNGEWYADDILRVDAGSLPGAGIWCFGAPCQDFSVAGKRAGLKGDRSSLVREIFRLLKETREEDRPEWLLYENVKGMLSSNRGFDFLAILVELDRWGYDIEWDVLNSNFFNVPQNRERVYVIGHLRTCGRAKIFPLKGTDGENCIHEIGHRRGFRRNLQVFAPDGITECLDAGQGGGRGPHTIHVIAHARPHKNNYGEDRERILGTGGISPTLRSTDHKEPIRVAIPVLTPERSVKKQNGRRFKDNGEAAFTLTVQDIHEVAIDLKAFSSKTRGQAYRYGHAATLDHNCYQGIFTEVSPELSIYAVWYPKEKCWVAIRKLTPKECFRLQGWEDDYFQKAQFVNSDSQLYKQAGNGVTVPVVYEIGKRLSNGGIV